MPNGPEFPGVPDPIETARAQLEERLRQGGWQVGGLSDSSPGVESPPGEPGPDEPVGFTTLGDMLKALGDKLSGGAASGAALLGGLSIIPIADAEPPPAEGPGLTIDLYNAAHARPDEAVMTFNLSVRIDQDWLALIRELAHGSDEGVVEYMRGTPFGAACMALHEALHGARLTEQDAIWWLEDLTDRALRLPQAAPAPERP